MTTAAEIDAALYWFIERWPFPEKPTANDQAMFMLEYERCRRLTLGGFNGLG